MEEKYPYFGEKIGTSFPGFLNSMDFAAVSHAMGNRWRIPCIAHIIKCTTGCESNRKKAPILLGKYEYEFPRFPTYDGFCRIYPGTNFIGFSHSMGFPAISHAMGDWWENPCISHMMKYTTGWESYEEKLPMLREKYEYQFPRFSPYDGLCCISPYDRKLMGKSMHFPYDEMG